LVSSDAIEWDEEELLTEWGWDDEGFLTEEEIDLLNEDLDKVDLIVEEDEV
jgi:hypothetical protein